MSLSQISLSPPPPSNQEIVEYYYPNEQIYQKPFHDVRFNMSDVIVPISNGFTPCITVFPNVPDGRKIIYDYRNKILYEDCVKYLEEKLQPNPHDCVYINCYPIKNKIIEKVQYSYLTYQDVPVINGYLPVITQIPYTIKNAHEKHIIYDYSKKIPFKEEKSLKVSKQPVAAPKLEITKEQMQSIIDPAKKLMQSALKSFNEKKPKAPVLDLWLPTSEPQGLKPEEMISPLLKIKKDAPKAPALDLSIPTSAPQDLKPEEMISPLPKFQKGASKAPRLNTDDISTEEPRKLIKPTYAEK
jgi:hypothetical protein